MSAGVGVVLVVVQKAVIAASIVVHIASSYVLVAPSLLPSIPYFLL